MEDENRIVITGLGVVSPLGSGNEFWDNLIKGKSGINQLRKFDITYFDCKIGGEAKFNPEDFDIQHNVVKNSDSVSLFALGAAKHAIEDSGLDLYESNPRVGCIIGTGVGGIETIEEVESKLYKIGEEKGPRKISSRLILKCMPNAPAAQVAINYKLKGPCFSVNSACAAGIHAIISATQNIILGEADVFITGGAEAPFVRVGYGSFMNMKALTRDYQDFPEKASRPFERDRKGFVMGEGSGIIVLERLTHAKQRNARIYAEIVGYGMTSDAYHITAPDVSGEGAIRAMDMALEKAKKHGIRKQDVDYINAHGTSTVLNDKTECLAIKQVFGKYALKLAVSSTKSMTGHLLGGAGGLESVICIRAIENNVIPPTINHENTAEDCKGLDYVPNIARKAEVDVVMNNSFGFGGHNACIIFKKYSE